MQSLTFSEKMFIVGAAFVLSYMVGLGFGLGAKHSGFYPFQPSAVVLERGKVEGVLEEDKQ